MGLFDVDQDKLDKGVSTLFQKSSGPRQRPAHEPKPNPEEVDDEEISELDSDEEFDDEKDLSEILGDLASEDEQVEDEQVEDEQVEEEEEEEGEVEEPKKRKRDDDEMETEDRYLESLASEAPEEPSKKDRKKTKESEESSILPNAQEVEKAEQTVFVNNVPSTVITDKKQYKQLKAFFSECGKVQSIRFRSIAFSEILPRKAAFIQQKLQAERDAINAYVVFDSKDACKKAVKLNGTVVLDHHLRIDSVAHPQAQDNKRSVFIGNLDFDMTEEPLWKHFTPCGEIEYVRLIRDSKTNMGKGFGYVQFKDSNGVSKALLLDGKKIDMPKGRKLRITRARTVKKDPKKDSKQVANKKARLSNDDKTKLGRAKGMVGKASKAQIDGVYEGARAKVGETVKGTTKPGKSAKKPRIRARSTAYKEKKRQNK